jgi:hypothetical protein
MTGSPLEAAQPKSAKIEVNLALLFAGNTCLLRKSTTHKTPQSADRFAIWLSASKRRFLFRHLAMIGVTTDAFCVDFWRFLLRSRTLPAKQRVHRLSSSFHDGFAGQERDHLPDQIYHTPSLREHVQPLQQTGSEAGGDLRAADVISDFAHRQEEIIER